MKKTILLTISICFAQLLTAQQNQKDQTSSVMKMLTSHSWVKTHEELGDVQLEFKADFTYMVRLSGEGSISGKFSLKGDLLTFETDSSCATKAEYTIKVTKETVNFTKKEDSCMGRNEITPGIWKAGK